MFITTIIIVLLILNACAFTSSLQKVNGKAIALEIAAIFALTWTLLDRLT